MRLLVLALALTPLLVACGRKEPCRATGEIGYRREAVTVRPYIVRLVRYERFDCPDGVTEWWPAG